MDGFRPWCEARDIRELMGMQVHLTCPAHVMHVRALHMAFLGVSDRWRLQRILAWPLHESDSHRDRLEPSAMHYDVDVCVCVILLVRVCVMF